MKNIFPSLAENIFPTVFENIFVGHWPTSKYFFNFLKSDGQSLGLFPITNSFSGSLNGNNEFKNVLKLVLISFISK